jgi:hypothetical protein
VLCFSCKFSALKPRIVSFRRVEIGKRLACLAYEKSRWEKGNPFQNKKEPDAREQKAKRKTT